MSKLIRFVFLTILFVKNDCEVYQDRAKIKTVDGDLVIEPAFNKNIYLRSNGPKSSVFVDQTNILNIKPKPTDVSGIVTNDNTDVANILKTQENILKRLKTAENILSEVPSSLSLNITLIWMKLQSIRRQLSSLNGIISNYGTDYCRSRPCLNGGTCLGLFASFSCICPPNWEGINCGDDVDECRNFAGTELGCQNGATCINKPGSYECLCRPSWYGLHCTRKAKDCMGGNFEMCGHGTCLSVTTGDGIACICDQGWTTNGTGVACLTDINECESKYGPRCSVNPRVECVNLPGSFSCGPCPSGYEGDGYTCSDIDECTTIPNGGCSSLVSCHNTIGSRICGPCPPGYQGDGITCTFRGSCNINHGGCHPSAQCVENNAYGGQTIQCFCPVGMIGDGLGFSGCYVLTNNNITLGCENNPCGAHGRCHLLRSGYTCICLPGYGGAHCDTPSNACTNNPCHNGGICRTDSNLLRGYRCECTSQYSGPLCQVLSKTCGGVLDHEEGSILYPSSNTSYSHNSKCAWVIHTVPGKVINVTFSRFNLENQSDCLYDFLQIHDGRSSANQLIGRFCGNTFPKNGNIISSNNNLYLWFRSDNTVAKDGFALHWTTIDPVCGGELDASSHGHISSPGSPGKYPPNRDCFWHLTTTYGKRIQLHFYGLDIETHPNCSFDYLEIYDGMHNTDPLLNKYCNSTQPAPVESASSNMMIHFHSDEYGSGNGFQISYAPIDGVPGCGGYFTSNVGEINSPSYNGSYLTNLLCEYKIKTDPDTKIRIDFKNFKLENSFKCRFDYLKIYDGPNSEAPLVGKFCGSEAYPKYYISSSNYLFLRFKTDVTLSSEGFKIMYQANCLKSIHGDSGIIKSPGYPFSYPENKVCEYIISTTPGKAIELTFQDFDIEDNRHYDCAYDYVEIKDGPDANSTLLGRYCGGANHIPPTATSTHNYLYVKFNSDISISGTGFYANYTTVDTECGGIFRKTTGLINYPKDASDVYENDQSCTWILLAPEGMHIKLTWNRFDIERTPSCNSDYLELLELDEDNVSSSMGKFCGTKSPPALTSSSNRILIKFTSDSSVRSSGFSLSYTYLDEKSHCGGTFFKTHGFIYSPGWPNRYEVNRDCTWAIIAPVGQQIRVNISQFDLERPIRNKCNNGDYLEFRNGGTQTAPLIGQYCGKFNTRIIRTIGNSLFIHFHSDYYLTGSGFRLEWEGSIVGCGGTLTSSSGSLSSPNYPENYNENSECFYKIVTNAGSRIKLSFTDLELERTNNCRDDYVEIYDGRDYNANSLGKYCFMSPELNNIETTSNYAFIKFRSDFYNEKKGFLLNYFTICNTNVTGRYGVIESPDFPNNYPLYLNCQWNIVVPKGNKINITFTNFDIFKISYYRSWWHSYRRTRDQGACDQDYLQWKDSTEHDFSKKTCGTDIPTMITSKSNLVQIKFTSSGIGSRSGFHLEWVNYGCGGHIQKPSGTISVDDLASSDEIECEWLIESSIGKSVGLVITNLFMSVSENCSTDALEMYNGQDITSPLLSRVCSKHSQPIVIRSTANFMFIRFIKRSSLKGASFISTFNSLPATCGGVIHSPSGFIYSKNYPKNYDENLDCNWMLTVPVHHKIILNFIDFDLYSYEGSDNCGDSIRIFDRFSPSSNYTYRICPQANVTSSITTKRNMALIQFTTDSFGNAKGFKMSFKATCGEEITAAYDGIISKAKYASDTNTSCVWTIMAENLDQKISLTITHLHLPKPYNAIASNRSCQSSYLRIYDGNDMNAPIIDEYCGSKAPPMMISRGSAVTVVFDSYDKKFLGQFSAHYSTLSTACGGALSSEEGSIVSPNYPRAYPAGVDCEWTLATSPGNRAYITFEQFNLENSERCNEDYLEIRKNNGAGELLGVYCGNDIPVNTTAGEKLYIKFHSNNENSGQGFLLHYGFLHGNDIVDLDRGEIASPLYPHMYHGVGEYSWRIFTNGASSITLTVDVFEIHSYTETCLSKLTFYDGYDDTAPLLTEMCGILTGQRRELRSSSNVIYIKLIMDESNSGALFHIGWFKSDKSHNEEESEKKINCGFNDTLLILPGNSSIIKTPNYPQEYDADSNCEWILKCTKGRHLSVHFLAFDIEETSNCFADQVSIYSSETSSIWKPLVEKVCVFDRVKEIFNASTYLKVNFKADSSVTRKGFKAIVKSECGGIITDLSGEVGPTWDDQSDHVPWNRLKCDWTITVRPGRIVKLQFIHFNITNKEDKCLSYVILRNGDSVESPLLSSGKYCGYSHEIRDGITTSSNSFHISFFSNMSPNAFQTFKIRYEEENIECGATSVLDADHSWEVISSPNYPDLPVPFSECIWKFSGPPGEILRIDFIDRFDLDFTSDCGAEVVEIRDGSSGLAPLKGAYCGEKPSTIKNTGNTMYIRYVTQLSIPRNGFKANISIDVCGGTIIAESGEITSPGYPHKYTLSYPSVCEWRIKGKPSHILTIVPKDVELPESESPCSTKLTIEEPIPGNNSVALLKTYCRNDDDLDMGSVQAFGNEIIIKFYVGKPSDWSRGGEDRGFRFIFNSTKPSCGGEITTAEGFLTTPNYPMETTLRFCQWVIKVPNKSRRIKLELLDVDIGKQEIYIANDGSFMSIIYSTIRANGSLSNRTYESSGSKISMFILLKHLSTSYKFKAKFSSDEESYCGGELSGLNGELVSPVIDSSLFCEWLYNNNVDNTDEIQYKSILVTVKMNSSITNTRCRINDPKLSIISTYDKERIIFPFTRALCTTSEVSYRVPSRSFSLKYSKKNTDLFDFNLKWKSQPCGGIIEVGDEFVNVLNVTNSFNETLDCAWIVRVPYGNRVDIKIEGQFDYNCDDEFISIKQGLSQYAVNTGTYCKTNTLEHPLKVNYRYIYVEYHSKPKSTNSLKLIVNNDKSQCGGELSKYRPLFESPNYPKNYDPYLECVWTITTSLGNRISLHFVDRFVIEDTPNCTKDAVILYDWKDDAFNEIGRLCGRNIPIPYNSTSNKMKIILRTDESTNMEGFKAIWNPFCGGNYIATTKQQFLYSPGYPSDYSGVSNCTYTILAPSGENLYIKFHEFSLEGKRPECEYDNLTISSNSDYRYLYEVYCGTDIPQPIINFDKVVITFKSDRFVQRKGFKLSFEIYSCNREVKEPTIITSSTGDHYDDNSNCTWKIEAPADKIIVFKFLYIDMESHYDCYNDFVAVYKDLLIDDDKRLALLCGHVNSTSVVSTKSNKALLHFKSDSSYNFRGFKVQVLFSYSESVGCGGTIDMTSLTTKNIKSFILKDKVVYENYLDCLWTILSAQDTVIKLEFTSFHISPCRNVNQTALGYSNCSCDVVEVRDGLNPDGINIGTYCGHNLPPPLISSTNSMSIRLSTDGEIVSSGFEAKLTARQSLCGRSHFTVSDKAVHVKSPGFANNQLPEGLHCNYYFDASDRPYSQIRISFVSMDLHPGLDDKSNKCDRDKIVIRQNAAFHNTSFDRNFIKSYNTDSFFSNNLLYYDETPLPRAVEICGSKKPADLYATGSFAVTLITSTELDSRHKGFEVEISYAGFCGRNYSDTYGKIQSLYPGNYEEIPTSGDCFTLITAPENCTISAYFITISPIWNSNAYLQIFDGNEIDVKKQLVKLNQNIDNIYPYFSTGRYLLLRNHKSADEYVNFDLNYVTTDQGRGCGGKLINEYGRVTSPMYPDIYRHKSTCKWELETPLGTHIKLHFAVFDLINIGNSCDQNYLQLVNRQDEVISSYCSETPADYVSSDNYVKIVFYSTLNNGGTGWMVDFYGVARPENV